MFGMFPVTPVQFLIVSFWFFVGEQILFYSLTNDLFQLKIKSDDCLILLWNEYQVLGKDIYQTIFKRITEGQCPKSNCQFTVDRNLQNQSSAIIFHMPNLHWENYSYPTYRDPSQNWILMSYESATNVRQRGSNWGRHPPINWQMINGLFNRTMSFRKDSDVVVRHGYIEKRADPLSEDDLSKVYGQAPLANFSHYTYPYFKEHNDSAAPIVWFVSHCGAHSGRDKYIAWLRRWIGVDIYGKCGDKQCGEVKNVDHEYSTAEDPCFHMVNRNYRFYISFENAICADYITEKTYNALKLNTIPIVLGGVNYTSLLPPKSFVNAAKFITPQALAAYLYTLLQHDDLYMEYFQWRKYFNVFSFTSVPDPCSLCEKVQSEEWKTPKVHDHMYDWFIMGSKCIFTNYKTPFFAVFQLLGAGIYHLKVSASIQVLAVSSVIKNSTLPDNVPILTNFTHILPASVLGVKFVNGKKKATTGH